MKLIVVGTGVAGSWLAQTALDEGYDVTVIDRLAGSGASSAALAVTRPSYLSREERPLLAESVARWDEITDVHRGALVTSYAYDDERAQRDWVAIRPQLPELLGAELIEAEARPLAPTAVLAGRDPVEADAVVWCDAGGGEEGRTTYGSTWIHDDPAALSGEEALRVHHLAPYRTVSAVRYADHCRIGSSSARTVPKALDQAELMLGAAVRLGWTEAKGWRRFDGARISRERLLSFSPEAGWRWSGFHRNGYALAPALAPGVLAEVVGAAELGELL